MEFSSDSSSDASCAVGEPAEKRHEGAADTQSADEEETAAMSDKANGEKDSAPGASSPDMGRSLLRVVSEKQGSRSRFKASRRSVSETQAASDAAEEVGSRNSSKGAVHWRRPAGSWPCRVRRSRPLHYDSWHAAMQDATVKYALCSDINIIYVERKSRFEAFDPNASPRSPHGSPVGPNRANRASFVRPSLYGSWI